MSYVTPNVSGPLDPRFMLLCGVRFSLPKVPAVFSTIRRSRTLFKEGVKRCPNARWPKWVLCSAGPRGAFARVIVRSSHMAFL